MCACTEYIEPTDNRTCFFRYSDFTETIELGQRSVYIDVCQIKHSMMRIQTADYMRTVNSLLADCSLNFVF